VNALAKPEVGKYLNEHCVATYQKVATFRLVGGDKQGGNVASYFTTPDGRVLHAVAGPVDGKTLLREARWAVETWKLGLLEARDEKHPRFRALLLKAHLDRLRMDHGVQLNFISPRPDTATPADMMRFLDYYAANGAPKGHPGAYGPRASSAGHQGGPRIPVTDKQARVHLLLASFPLPRIERVYGVVFHKILNEKLSTVPVVQK
jgi:hypothetical protein